MFRIDFSSGRVDIIGTKSSRRIRSEKWSLFLSLLAQNAARQGGFVNFESILRHTIFSQKKSNQVTEDEPVKPISLIRREIGNFVRNLKKSGYDILIYQSAENGGWAINLDVCEISKFEIADPNLKKHTATLQEIAFDFDESDVDFVQWLLLMTNAKASFWQGHMHEALNKLILADKIVQSDLLTAATYTELARIAYRAEGDRVIDWREKTIDFIANNHLPPLIQAIYQPRIEASYQFSRDSGLDSKQRVEALENLSCNFIQGVDISGLCRAFNITFITYQATGDGKTRHGKSKALTATRAACALSITVGDPDLIQASIFNYVLALRLFGNRPETLKMQQKLLRYNYKFCKTLNVGEDSAQASLVLADIHLDLNNLRMAKIALIRSSQIIRKTKNMLDRALFYSLAGTYALMRDKPSTTIAENRAKVRYLKSIEYYEYVGREDAADGVRVKMVILDFSEN